MQANAIITQEQAAIEDVKRLANIVIGLRNDVFKEGLDYGKIPGTGDKPTLLKPGMDKLCKALHLRPEYVEKSIIEDFDKPLIYYRYECRLIDYDTGICEATAIGSANSHETKWRWREQKRTCPKCGKEAIRRSKFPPKNNPNAEPGWYCYDKDGGCGANFAVDAPSITSQQVGRIENPDIFDQMNTIDKIAQKRALGSAILLAANVSELFTVDLEDFKPYAVSNVVEGTWTEVEDGVDAPPQPTTVQPPTQPQSTLNGAHNPPLSSMSSTDAGATEQGVSNDDLFPPVSEDYRTVTIPTLGNLNMRALGKRAYDEGLVRGQNHWGNLITKMKDEGWLRDAMNEEQVLEAIRKREAEKDLAKGLFAK